MKHLEKPSRRPLSVKKSSDKEIKSHPLRGCWDFGFASASYYWGYGTLKEHRHGYDPTPVIASLKQFLDVVDRDEYGCFFG